jgi:predicted ester cyclase
VTAGDLCVSYLESFATGDPDRIAAHVSDGFVNEHVAVLGSSCTGKDEYLRRLPGFLDSLPGLRYEIDDVIADGNRVAVAYTLHAQLGDRSIRLPGLMRFRVEGDRIAHRVDYWDSLAFQQQAGMA